LTKNLQLELYILGGSAASARAKANIKALIASKELKGRCQLKIIDIRAQPELAERENLVATPTLLKKNPPPKKIIGDLSNCDMVLFRLGIKGERPVKKEVQVVQEHQRNVTTESSGRPVKSRGDQLVRSLQTERRKKHKS
jgi:circadian clock protein KaiB